MYLDWAKARLDEVDATVASLVKTAGKVQGEGRTKADHALADIRARGDAFRKAIAAQREGSEAAWSKAKTVLEADWKAFEASVQEYVDAAGQKAEEQKAAFQARADAQMKAWRKATDQMSTTAAGFAAASREEVDSAVKRMVAEAGLGLAPGAAFGPEGEGWLRWCFASRDPARLAEGAERLAAFLRL